MTAVHDTDQTPDLRATAPRAPGPRSSDEELLAWRHAAANGDLPTPTRNRWQQLRGGVVNMWEFDVEEYWCADGRAQFVGGNETGKSTLMTLTTLIMLAGSLDRSNIDTFGQQHKSFRYYLEPTDGPKDRRDTSAQTNRGWTWVEYARLADGVPEYFTTLLYGQTKRAVADLPRTWLTCTGGARVRDGITLVHGQSVRTPSDIADVPGLVKHPNGSAYKQAVSTGLFGFTEPDRIESTIGMLKLLRTPQLGQLLDPTWFTDQMRQALPRIDQTEINELAEGWDQLDRLARDRDSAAEARDAVKSYLRRGWIPWADVVLRRAADELAAATTEFDNVTRRFRDAEQTLANAEKHLTEIRRQRNEARRSWDDLAAEYDTLIKSRAYLDAQAATDRVEAMSREAAKAAARAGDLAAELKAAHATAERSAEQLTKAEAEARGARKNRDAAAETCAKAFEAAGLPAAAGWATAGDVDRLQVASTERRTHVNKLRQLIRVTDRAEAEHRNRDSLLAEATGREIARGEAVDQADRAAAAALQELSDALEAWVVRLPEDVPSAELREQWLAAVTTEASAVHPRALLRGRIGADWVVPATEPLTSAAGAARSNAEQRTRQARDLQAQAADREKETDPTPSPPPGWVRRTRRPAGEPTAGAPLWRMLDPAPGVDSDTLARIEAALAGAGLLDAWVTPDQVWIAERDGDDAVIALTDATFTEADRTQAGATGAPDGPRTLGRVLVAAAGPLAGAAERILRTVAYTDKGGALSGVYAISSDGRWRTPVTSGRAAPEHEGASLLGAAARAAARQRQVAALRGQAERLHTEAATLMREAAELTARVHALRAAADRAPADDDVVATARAATASAAEFERAVEQTKRARDRAREAENAANDARAGKHTYAGDHQLPVDDTLDDVAAAVDTAAAHASDLRSALREVFAAERRRQELARRAAEDAETEGRRRQATDDATAVARRAKVEFETAQRNLGATEQEVLGGATKLTEERDAARRRTEWLQSSVEQQGQEVAKAQEALKQHDRDRGRTEADRTAALQAWWAPVDAGLAAARGLDPASGRLVTAALAQARQAREKLQPRRWPEGRDRRSERDAIVTDLFSKMVGEHLMQLNLTLEATGGRTATAVTSEDPHVLPQVRVLVDASGVAVDPVIAVTVLDEKAAELARLHDEKLHSVLEELLSSTFVEHLRDRMGGVLSLLGKVNNVLAAHATGSGQTVLRLTHVPAADQADGSSVLNTLIDGFVDAPAVQEEVRRFLERQIRDAQELGAETGTEWKEHLATLLDYRRWFDVITEFKVLTDGRKRPWKALTKEVHGQDSGGAKVVTLLQPLLATLVAMYDECDHAPRPLWLDEAFEGVDADNRSTMLDLFIDFDLDFLLAGPGNLVASANVPSAAVWFVHKAPGTDPGVSLSLMLWAGNELTPVSTPAPVWHHTAPLAGEETLEATLWV